MCNETMYYTVKVTVYCNNRSTACIESLEELLSDSSVQTFTLPSESTYDDVFHSCAKSCGITALYLPLFALRDINSNKWLNLNRKLHDQEVTSEDRLLQSRSIDVEFRVRFTFKSNFNEGGMQHCAHRYSSHDDSSKPVMNDKIIKYLFHQSRFDFLKGKSQFIETHQDKMGAALGVAVFDVLRLASETKCDIMTVANRLSRYTKLLPVSCRKTLSSLNFLMRYRVYLRFKHYLTHYKSRYHRLLNTEQKPACFYIRYLNNLEKVVGENHTETYDLMSKTSTKRMKHVTIGADCGIVEGDRDDEEQWCDFHEITDMKIHCCQDDSQSLWIISISQLNGKILNLSFSNKTDAHNLASGIDGYYQLLTDPHHFLCEDVTSPSLIKRLACFCHGPISRAYADSCIRQQPQLHVGDGLLRQSQESTDEYYINVVEKTSPIETKVYMINQERSESGVGKLQINGDSQFCMHETLSSLLRACGDSQRNNEPVPFYTDNLIQPNSKSHSYLKVYRCSDSQDAEEKGNLNHLNSDAPSTGFIMQKDFRHVCLLGAGKFSDVRLYERKDKRQHRVVFKKLYDPPEIWRKQHVEESFQESMYQLNFLKNDHIVHLVGTMKTLMVLEYVPYGSITDYLQNADSKFRLQPDNPISTEWFLRVLWQLAHACTYLEDKSCAHGNIRAKNILLWRDLPQPHIKLADPGVRTYTDKKYIKGDSVQKITEPILMTPWLANEFCTSDNRILISNYPTVNGDKWSYASTVCEICNWGSLPLQPQGVSCLSDDIKQRYAAGDVMEIPDVLSANDTLATLIQQCWNTNPQKRPEFKKLLRELGAVLASDHVFSLAEPKAADHVESHPSSSVLEFETYKDSDLILIRSLGKGNFGQVDLYTCDRDGGRAERVAVKSLLCSRVDLKSTCEFNNEIETMRKLNHKYVVQFKGVAEPSLRIVMEYLPQGSLSDYLKAKRDQNVQLPSLYNKLFAFSCQICQGMLALQAKRLIHRDLALRNILLARDVNSSFYVKIADFGLARTLKEDSSYYKGGCTEIPVAWYAPECLVFDRPSAFHFASDVWSFGVTLWEMFSYAERPNYETLRNVTFTVTEDLRLRYKELHQLLEKGIRLLQPPQCPDRVYNLITKCWDYDPSERIKFEELLQSFEKLSTNKCSNFSSFQVPR